VQAAALALLASDPAQARRLVGRCLRLARESGGHENLEMTLGYAAVLVASEGHHEPAARVWGAAESIGAAIGVAPQWRAAFSAVEEPQRQTTERALGEAAMRRADVAGRAMSIEQAIALALEQLAAS
jgi:hypothetical protein